MFLPNLGVSIEEVLDLLKDKDGVQEIIEKYELNKMKGELTLLFEDKNTNVSLLD